MTDITDLAALEPDQMTIDVPIITNDEGETVSGFKVRGANSKEYQEATRKVDIANIKRTHARGRPMDAKTEEGAGLLVDLIAKREMAIAVACVAEMYGFTLNGEPAQTDSKTLTDIFTKRPTWRKKVVAAVENEANFTGG